MQHRAIAVLAVTILASLAGCLDPAPATGATNDGFDPNAFSGVDTAGLPEAQYDMLPMEEVWSTMSDGKRMYSAVYRPNTDEPVGAFINFSPYWGDTAELQGDHFSQYLIHEYVPRGFAVILTAIRGTGHSEGCFEIGSHREVQDLYEVIDDFSGASWSNGRFAVGGKSYDSTPQNGLLAMGGHPNLKGAFHVSGITDMYRYNYKDGVPFTQGPIFNTYYFLQGTDEYGASFLSTPGPDTLGNEDAKSMLRLLDDLTCAELPQMQLSGVGSAVTGERDSYWDARNWIDEVSGSTWEGSLFFVHGLQDWNVKPDNIDDWLDQLPTGFEPLVWLHQDQEGGTGHVYPMRDDWNQTMLAWLDMTLNGVEGRLDDVAPIQSEGTDGLYRGSTSWRSDWELHQVELTGPGTVIEGPARVVGEIHVDATYTFTGLDNVATATFAVGEDWQTEGFFRMLLENEVGIGAQRVQFDTFPIDLVLQEGESLEFRAGDDARYGLTTPMTKGIFLAGTLSFHTAPLDTVIANHPTDISCFAC